MHITPAQLRAMRQAEEMDRLYTIEGTHIPGRNYDFYRSFINSRCVKRYLDQEIIYLSSDRQKTVCMDCIEEPSCPVSKALCLEVTSWHQLVPTKNPQLCCSFCGRTILKSSNPYRCNDCKREWLWHRDLIERGATLDFEHHNK